jgi:uncharacterized protein YegP (UPF0339 family)
MAKFDIYKDKRGKFRWRLKARNGQKVATSGESFASRSNAKRAAESVKAKAGKAEIAE